MPAKTYIVLFFLFFCTKLLSQAESDSSRCINLYENEKDWSLAIKDTCLVSLAMGSIDDGYTKKYKVPSTLAKIKNLHVLTIQSTRIIEIEKTSYKFEHLYDVYIKGRMNNSTFPPSFFSS